eukprot:m.78672 g.78672  ORF g.78672 m.78672 type:complete len:208 (+) comp14507_c0_seq15:2377-3000(+)
MSLRSARVLVNLAILYDRNKDYVPALAKASTAVDELVAARGKDFPSALRAMRVKARCEMHLDRRQDAKSLLEGVLTIMADGHSKEDLAETKALVVEVITGMGLVDEARKLAIEVGEYLSSLDQLDEFQKETMPKLDPYLAFSDTLIYEAAGKLALAIVSQKEVIAILTTVANLNLRLACIQADGVCGLGSLMLRCFLCGSACSQFYI